MKILFIAVILFCSLNWATASVEVDANFKNTEKGLVLNIILKNPGKDNIYIPTLAGQLIDLRLDLWCTGKGIELYPKYDAEWRRAQAFINYEWQLLKPGDDMQVSVNLEEMMPSDPENDEVAKKIVNEFSFLKKGRAYVSAMASKTIPKPAIKDKIYQIYQYVRIAF